MFAQTVFEDLSKIGQFVKESHSKIKIWLTSAIGCISTCRSGVELLEKIFPSKISWCFGPFRTPRIVFRRECCEKPNLAALRAVFEHYRTYMPRGVGYRSKNHEKYWGIWSVIMRQSSSGPKTGPRAPKSHSKSYLEAHRTQGAPPQGLRGTRLAGKVSIFYQNISKAYFKHSKDTIFNAAALTLPTSDDYKHR